jgi:WD40 repeat protein
VVVVLCHQGQLLLIDPQTARVRHQPPAHAGKTVNHGYAIRDHIRFSPSGDRFAIWGVGSAVQIHKTLTGEALCEVRHNLYFVHDVRFSPDEHVFVSCSSDNEARTWYSETGKPAGPVLPHAGWVLNAQFSRDGTRLLTACQDQHARVWDWRIGRVISTTLKQSDEIYGVTFLGNDELYVTGTKDGVINVWDSATSKQLAPTRSVPNRVYQLAVGAGGTQLIASSLDGCYGFHVDDWIIEPESQLKMTEMTLLSEVLSGQRIHENGAATSLTQSEWMERRERSLRADSLLLETTIKPDAN